MSTNRCRYMRVIMLVVCTLGSVCTMLMAQGRKFTVVDSIEMQRLTDPYPDIPRNVTKFSPDGKSFLVVTTRGIVSRNLLESTIWLFDVESEKAFLSDGTRSLAPKPEVLITRAGANDNEQQDLQAAIRSPQWSADGQSVLFLGRTGDTTWHLYRLEVKTKKLDRLSAEQQSVIAYQERGQVVVYAVSIPWPAAPLPRVVVGTGESLHNLMFPNNHSSYPNQNELWLYSRHQSHPVVDPFSHKIVRLNTHSNDTILSMDPNGRYAIVAAAVTTIPEIWTSYEPGSITGRIALWPQERLKHAYGMDIPEKLLLVDLRTGKSSALLDAPLGRDVNWFGATKVMWSSDGSKILLANVFLPIVGVSDQEKADRKQQPAVVCFDLHDRTWTLVARYRHSSLANSKKWQVRDVNWGKSADEVVISYTELGPPAETLHRVDHSWGLTEDRKSTGTNEAALPLLVSLKESLTTPPSLFASISSSAEAKRIWDPNPQFEEIAFGNAEIYDWKDRYGRDVKGVLIRPSHFDPKQRYPLVIEPRAYSQDLFVVDGTYPTAVAAQAMAADGLMVLQAGEPAVTQKDAFREETPAALAGYEAVITKLSAEGLIDPNRVGIIGFSRTCDNVMYALTQNPKLFAAATIANGFTYGPMGYFETIDASLYNGAKDQWALHYGGNPFGDALSTYVKENSIFNLRNVTAPLRVETHDPSIMLSDWESYAGLRSLGKPVDLIVLPYATHVVTMPADLMESQQGDVDWFRFWLQGYEDPDPAKVSQYARWRQLRTLKESNDKAAMQSEPDSTKLN